MKIARIVYLSMVRFRLLRLFMYIHKWTSGSLCPSTENSLQLYLAQVNVRISIVYCRAKIKKYPDNFCPTSLLIF